MCTDKPPGGGCQNSSSKACLASQTPSVKACLVSCTPLYGAFDAPCTDAQIPHSPARLSLLMGFLCISLFTVWTLITLQSLYSPAQALGAHMNALYSIMPSVWPIAQRPIAGLWGLIPCGGAVCAKCRVRRWGRGGGGVRGTLQETERRLGQVLNSPDHWSAIMKSVSRPESIPQVRTDCR